MDTFRLPRFEKNWAFFLDIDGTLAEIAPTPEDAKIPRSTIDDLVALQRETGLALISGRSLSSIDSLTYGVKFPAAGQHGLEIRFSQREIVDGGANKPAMDALTDIVKLFHVNYPGLIIEYKGLSIAIHYRMRPGLAETVDAFLKSLVKSRENIMCLQYGKMVVEIKLRGSNKGTAIEAFMKTAAFRNKIPVFAGDDQTDEDAYRIVNSRGGITIQIGEQSQNARFSLPTPMALRAWLKEIVTPEMAEAV